jgi:predicted SAM-dependent methyltransferase
MRLHLGCFDCPLVGWHNTDITPHLWISRIPLAARLLYLAGMLPPFRWQQHRDGVFRKVHYLNVAKTFPLPDNSVEPVFSSHVIEHLSPEMAKLMLEESYRVMKVGGVCRIVAPSLEWAMTLYSDADPAPFLGAVFEHEHQKAKNRHQWMYTGASLAKVMAEAGLTEVEILRYREGRLPDLASIDNRPENSIYVEGVKR